MYQRPYHLLCRLFCTRVVIREIFGKRIQLEIFFPQCNYLISRENYIECFLDTFALFAFARAFGLYVIRLLYFILFREAHVLLMDLMVSCSFHTEYTYRLLHNLD